MSQQARWPDAQTGFYYYGARYYNPRVSVWLSTDPLMEKYPNVNPYVYCLDNPINLLDPDGRDVIGWLYSKKYSSGIINKSSSKLFNLMNNFIQTSYGTKFISQFMKRGQSIFNHTAKTDGKYSNYILRIVDVNDVSPGERGAFFKTRDGYAEGKFITTVESGRLTFNVWIDTNYSEDKIMETLIHEMALHGHKVEEYIKKFEELGAEKFKIWLDNNPSGDDDHTAIRGSDLTHEGFNEYTKSKNDLLKKHPKYKKQFDDKKEFYKNEYEKL